MISKKFIVQNKLGLHARPASNFTKIATRFESDITVTNGDKKCNPKSLIGVLSACIKYGNEIEISCDGPDEEEAMAALIEGLESGLGE